MTNATTQTLEANAGPSTLSGTDKDIIVAYEVMLQEHEEMCLHRLQWLSGSAIRPEGKNFKYINKKCGDLEVTLTAMGCANIDPIPGTQFRTINGSFVLLSKINTVISEGSEGKKIKVEKRYIFSKIYVSL